MKLSKLEQETIILYNQEETTASVYTHDPKLISKLRRLSEKHPDKVYPERNDHTGAVSYIVPKSCVSIREPYSDARKLADSERAKKAGITPPTRSVCSDNK
ncbi:MAG: immunoglobulin [Clostridiales bacterium]|nr:immunoglobulin [Oscillospiraceae bacterium]NLU24255.1 immunoglobulin [Clostridiales bacterium]